MEKLGKYELTGQLTSQNSGYSIWGFGKKDGKDFFIKQFLSPKYPENDTASSPERLAKKRKQCVYFEQQKKAIYSKLNEVSDGNAVRVTEFFRIESKYYISMPKIEALSWDIATITSLSEKEKRFLCTVIAHGIAQLHMGRIVHADLKHDNILFTRTASGYVTAKIIDFDSSFLETDPPAAGDEIIGDLVYFSPEACRSVWGEKVELTCKMDIFALGILFHQYFTGVLPAFHTEQSSYPGEAVAKGESLKVSTEMPGEIHDLLTSMLNSDPHNRPTAIEVYNVLADKKIGASKEADTTAGANSFFRPGDL